MFPLSIVLPREDSLIDRLNTPVSLKGLATFQRPHFEQFKHKLENQNRNVVLVPEAGGTIFHIFVSLNRDGSDSLEAQPLTISPFSGRKTRYNERLDIYFTYDVLNNHFKLKHTEIKLTNCNQGTVQNQQKIGKGFVI